MYKIIVHNDTINNCLENIVPDKRNARAGHRLLKSTTFYYAALRFLRYLIFGDLLFQIFIFRVIYIILVNLISTEQASPAKEKRSFYFIRDEQK